jgi:hypothetical protein
MGIELGTRIFFFMIDASDSCLLVDTVACMLKAQSVKPKRSTAIQ